MTSQTSVPQSSSCSHAAAMIRAASAALGGSGCGARCFGFLAVSAGFVRIHSHRTAAASAALMIQCTCRIDDADIGVQRCGGHSTTTHPAFAQSCASGPGRPGRRLCRTTRHSCSAVVRWSTAGSPFRQRCRQRRSSAYSSSSTCAETFDSGTDPRAGSIVRRT